jgi:hypothetical protein
MTFEEIIAASPTAEEGEDETKGNEDIAMFMEECGEALLFGLGH